MVNFVVVFDPDNELPEGKILVSDQRYYAAVRRGVVLLPVAEGSQNSLSPWAKFAYGDGVDLNTSIPSYAGRGALWLARRRGSVAWAGLVRFSAGTKPEGQLRLVGDPTQAPIPQAPVQDESTNSAALASPAAVGDTWAVLTGKTGCVTAMDAIFAFALHGYARDCRLAWLTLAQFE